MKKNVLLLNRGSFIKYYDKNGAAIFDKDKYSIFVITNKDRAQNISPDEYEELYACNLNNYENVVKIAEQIDERFKIDFVFTFSERDILTAAKIRELLNVEGLKYEDALCFRDKYIMKKVLKDNGILVPEFDKLQSREQALNFLNKFHKIVIKPISGAGSINTFIITSTEEIDEALDVIKEDLHDYEIEQFISGNMYHCDSVIENGKILISSLSVYQNSTINYEDGGYLSSIMEDEEVLINKVREFNSKIINSLKLRSGITHLELFVDNSTHELVFCEIAARIGGGGILQCIGEVYSISLNEVAIRLELNEKLPEIKKNNFISGFIIFHPRKGKIKSVSSIEKFNKDWIPFCRIYAKVGEEIHDAKHSSDAIAVFVLLGSSKSDLLSKVEYIKDEFKIEYDNSK